MSPGGLISVGFYFIRCLHCPVKPTALSPGPCVSLCVEHLSLCVGAEERVDKTAHDNWCGYKAQICVLGSSFTFLSRNVCTSDSCFVAGVVGRKCFTVMHVLGFLCDILPCLVYSDIQKPLSPYGKQTKVQVVDLAAGEMSGELGYLCHTEAGLSGVCMTASLFSD